MTVYLDTHAVIWVIQGDWDQLGPAARRAIGECDLVVSPAVVLELELLHKIGRLRVSASSIVTALTTDIGLRVCDLPFRMVVDYALKENWGRDPFDRLIVANAKAAEAPLVTKDARIRRHYSRVIW
jgi:PIN domain nuclease of toxin-antitoxin system